MRCFQQIIRRPIGQALVLPWVAAAMSGAHEDRTDPGSAAGQYILRGIAYHHTAAEIDAVLLGRVRIMPGSGLRHAHVVRYCSSVALG